MKIGKPTEKSEALAGPASPAPASEAAKATSAPAIPSTADASAKIALSSQAASLIAGGPSAEFDSEKVSRVIQALADGSYKVDPEVIADKLIANAKELLSKT